MIRIDALWLAAEPINMRAGAERLLARVVQVFGAAQAHHGYLFANARGMRIKLLVHDGFGVCCAARRLNAGASPGRVRPRDAIAIAHTGIVLRLGAGASVATSAGVERHHTGLKRLRQRPQPKR